MLVIEYIILFAFLAMAVTLCITLIAYCVFELILEIDDYKRRKRNENHS